MRMRDRRWSLVVSRSPVAVRCSSFARRFFKDGPSFISWRSHFGNLAVVGGAPSPTRYIRIKTLGRISRQSLERKIVIGKVLIALELVRKPSALSCQPSVKPLKTLGGICGRVLVFPQSIRDKGVTPELVARLGLRRRQIIERSKIRSAVVPIVL